MNSPAAVIAGSAFVGAAAGLLLALWVPWVGVLAGVVIGCAMTWNLAVPPRRT